MGCLDAKMMAQDGGGVNGEDQALRHQRHDASLALAASTVDSPLQKGQAEFLTTADAAALRMRSNWDLVRPSAARQDRASKNASPPVLLATSTMDAASRGVWAFLWLSQERSSGTSWGVLPCSA